jgi:septal ring factor EnvC (AmiA/AmiB activator)
MNKSDNTKVTLLNAIDRIVSGKTVIVSSTRKLSVRAVEDEANLGDGSAYYYQDVIEHIKSLKSHKINTKIIKSNSSELKQLKEKLVKERRIKEKYRTEIKVLKEQMSLMAATHNALAITNRSYEQKIKELESVTDARKGDRLTAL